ncbi:DUF1206 domain-containing protein [Cellulosimicrobium marinum]|uniref:DUF1206 domain-containing protein n=1 Tax=Cellulosimicrobium marinum TaxID=1638992 RepID=UPI001E55B136|nr:DUF1206 domain-containing protein [Cellulosimicrobium marinum]MCB7135443.1 DUF1206 domain-containing protein [Cellulosimicrobium marinum]
MASSMSSAGKSGARSARSSKTLEMLARAGYAVSGVLHLVVGVLAVQVATGSASSEEASQTGALAAIAETPGGSALLWFAVVAFAALGLWQLTVALSGSPKTSDRLKAVGKALVYLALGALAVQVVTGASSGSGQEESFTARLMQNPGGVLVVGAVGVGIVVAGVYHVVKGWKKKFLQDLRGGTGGTVGTAVVQLGRVGYIAKGVALGVLGALFVVAAVQNDPEQAGGLDAAFATVAAQPFGTALLVAIGLGFAAYGLYSFARARYARM